MRSEDRNNSSIFGSVIKHTVNGLKTALEKRGAQLLVEEVGSVKSIGQGIALVEGLPNVAYEELVVFPGDRMGMVLDIKDRQLGVVLFDESQDLEAGTEVRRSGKTLHVPVGEALIGRIVDPLARPLDHGGPIRASEHLPTETEAPPIVTRAPVSEPLQTGLKVLDAIIPIGKGQRELILGDRQTGKTAIAVDTIINQKGCGVLCIYCAVGKRGSAVAKVVDDLRTRGAMEYTTCVVATADKPPGIQFVAPYAATAMGEHFMRKGKNVLVVYDDLTTHARAYREISLLMRRPPGREAYPGDIFYIHSRLLERSTHLLEEFGGGSLTALPIIETEAQNISGYIPTNLISITDGQVYLSPDLFQKGILPAVDVGKSVSRVGGKSQLAAFRSVVGDLKLAYSQYEELETFSRFGTRLDESTRQTLERGRRVREILKQPQYSPMPVCDQIMSLVSVNQGALDQVPVPQITHMEERILQASREQLREICSKIEAGEDLTHEDRDDLTRHALKAVNSDRWRQSDGNR